MTPEEILEKLRQKWDDLMAKAQQLLEAFNNTLDTIGRFAGWIAEKAVNFWNDHVVPKWQEAVDWMGEHWNVFGAPWLCFGSAGDWRTLVGQPVSERAGLATKGQLEVDTTWKGSGLVIGTGALTALCLNAKGDLLGVRSKLSGYPEGAWPAFG